jgi:hypothetical protein
MKIKYAQPSNLIIRILRSIAEENEPAANPLAIKATDADDDLSLFVNIELD